MLAKPALEAADPVGPPHLGRFRLLRVLGQGAQSVVYLGFDPQLQREVAIKALQGEAASMEALLNEARAVGRLSHPGIVPVFEVGQGDAGSAAPGAPYLVFEYVPGRTLAEVLQLQGAIEAELAVRLLLPALDAVAYAHESGVIHRDLKPSNILLDSRGHARVMDFGIAVRATDAADPGADAASRPMAGERPLAQCEGDAAALALAGTPAYMAPEYARDGQVSQQMDVFSAGLILYELLVGKRAVPDERGYRVMLYLLHHDVRLPEALPYAVDTRLRAIVEQALQRERTRRYATMRDLTQALRHWLRDADLHDDAEPAARLRAVVHPGTVVAPATRAGQSEAPTQPEVARRTHELAAAAVPSAAQKPTSPAVVVEAPLQAEVQLAQNRLEKLKVLLRRVQSHRGLPQLPSTVSQVMPLASADRQNLGVLAEVVCADLALSLRLLRMVNSSLYAGTGQGAICGVSTAIQLLGYASVRGTAAASPTLQAGADRSAHNRTLDVLLLACWSGTLAQAMSGLRDRDGEEAYLCGALQWLGELLLQQVFANQANTVELHAPLGGVAPFGASAQTAVLGGHRSRAVRLVLGVGLDVLAGAVLQQWGLPPLLVQSLYALGRDDDGSEPTLGVPVTQNRAEYLRALACCAHEMAHAWLLGPATLEEQRVSAIAQRYGQALGTTMADLRVLQGAVTERVRRVLQQHQSGLGDLRASRVARRLGLQPQGLPLPQGCSVQAAEPPPAGPTVVPGRGGAGVALSLELLAAAEHALRQVPDAASRADADAALRQLLGAVQRATGLERVLLADGAGASKRVQGRLITSGQSLDVANEFELTLNALSDPFAAALRDGRELWVPDTARVNRRPQWHRERFAVGAYLLLPLRDGGQVLGALYADHGRHGEVALTDRVLAQLRVLADLSARLLARYSGVRRAG